MKDKEILILEKLEEIVARAKENGMTIDETTIKEVFSDMELDSTQLSMIEDYIISKAISVGDRSPDIQENSPESDLDLLNQISADLLYYANEEDDLLLEDLLNSLLAKADEWTIPYEEKGLLKEDLLQECALVLSEFILSKDFIGENYGILQECDSDKLDKFASDIIRISFEKCTIAMKDLSLDSNNFKKTTSAVVDQVNNVNDGAIAYKEEFGIKPTPKELAEFLKVDEDYILDTVQMSGYLIDTIDFDTPVNKVKDMN